MLARTAPGTAWQALTAVTVGGGADTPPCAPYALCRAGADALTRPFTLTAAVTYDMVEVRSLVEHVLELQRVRPSSPVAALADGGAVSAAVMEAASIEPDSHTYHPLAHAHVHAASAVDGARAPAPPPPLGRAGDLGAVAEEAAPVSSYSNAPASPAVHQLQTKLLAAANLGPHDYTPRVRMQASPSARGVASPCLPLHAVRCRY